MTPRQRSAFILFDGKRDSEEIMKATAGLGVTLEDVRHLVSLGLLAPQLAPVAAAPVPVLASAATVNPPPSLSATLTASAQAPYLKAYPVATRLTAGLGLRGFRLNLAVEAAGDLDKLRKLAPRIKDAVGAEKFLELQNALDG